jgi:hypothetical protein
MLMVLGCSSWLGDMNDVWIIVWDFDLGHDCHLSPWLATADCLVILASFIFVRDSNCNVDNWRNGANAHGGSNDLIGGFPEEIQPYPDIWVCATDSDDGVESQDAEPNSVTMHISSKRRTNLFFRSNWQLRDPYIWRQFQRPIELSIFSEKFTLSGRTFEWWSHIEGDHGGASCLKYLELS